MPESPEAALRFTPPQTGPASSSRVSQPAMSPVISLPVELAGYRISQMCDSGEMDPESCKVRWRGVLAQSGRYLAIEHLWNVATNRWVRFYLKGPFFRDWFDSVANFRFSRWNDDDLAIASYVGHPMMGSITNYIFIQNDPRGMTLGLENTPRFWKSRLRALAWSALYSAQWKLGPLSEASIGNTGKDFYWDPDAKKITNGTGMVDLVITPVGGLVWMLGEDLIDQHLLQRLERKSSNRAFLAVISFLNPTRSFANLLRFRSPWHRESRPVGRPELLAIEEQFRVTHPPPSRGSK